MTESGSRSTAGIGSEHGRHRGSGEKGRTEAPRPATGSQMWRRRSPSAEPGPSRNGAGGGVAQAGTPVQELAGK
ncbi:hypothetical protein XELAEV_18024776mg [Xenopus laevis]|uniref:Uncharacterized protein n=1 Tax=Xenopus laevis TaxID=8355 RepID=A0A974D0W1_XENLA|nr:hypothetical protein XELAEV_18024776mg [Xenopus laevis]